MSQSHYESISIADTPDAQGSDLEVMCTYEFKAGEPAVDRSGPMDNSHPGEEPHVILETVAYNGHDITEILSARTLEKIREKLLENHVES